MCVWSVEEWAEKMAATGGTDGPQYGVQDHLTS